MVDYNLREIFKFRSFLRSKSVNSVCKLLQLLGNSSPDHPGYIPQMKIPAVPPPLLASAAD